MQLKDYLTIALVAGAGMLILKNKDTISSIGSGISSTVSGALGKIQSKVVREEGGQS